MTLEFKIYHPALSRREKEVCELFTMSYKPKEIGEILGLKRHCVGQYLYKTSKKYGVHGRVELLKCLKNRYDRGLLFNETTKKGTNQ